MPSLQLAPVRSRVARFASLLVLIVAAASISSRADDAPPHVVMISIDGLKPEAYTQPGPADVPTLRKLAAEGAFARGVVGIFPTVTYPSHTTLITGVTPAVHGIYNNRILDAEDRSDAGWYWYARDITAPTLPGVGSCPRSHRRGRQLAGDRRLRRRLRVSRSSSGRSTVRP